MAKETNRKKGREGVRVRGRERENRREIQRCSYSITICTLYIV